MISLPVSNPADPVPFQLRPLLSYCHRATISSYQNACLINAKDAIRYSVVRHPVSKRYANEPKS